MMEDLTQAPEVLENLKINSINSQDNCNDWSSWNPAQLQNKKSGKLSSKCAEKKIKNSGTLHSTFSGRMKNCGRQRSTVGRQRNIYARQKSTGRKLTQH